MEELVLEMRQGDKEDEGELTTPPPPRRLLFAALTIDVTASVVISARMSDILALREAEGEGREGSVGAGCRREVL